MPDEPEVTNPIVLPEEPDKPDEPEEADKEHPHGGAPGQTGIHPQGGPPGQMKDKDKDEDAAEEAEAPA
jgi:hypothetical protein